MKGKYALLVMLIMGAMGFGSCGNDGTDEVGIDPVEEADKPELNLDIPMITTSTAVIPLTFDVDRVKGCRFGLVYSKRKDLELGKANSIECDDSTFSGRFEVHIEGLESGESYFYRSFVKGADGKIEYGDIESFVTMAEESRAYTNTSVNLGLSSGTKWAKYNVGATNEADTGNYYSWGEITAKNIHDWQTYKYSIGNTDAISKYSSLHDSIRARHRAAIYNLAYDDKTCLDLSDDVANTEHGGLWHMPNLIEWQELYNECKWTLVRMVNSSGKVTIGYSVTKPSSGYGTSIFLPMGGFKGDSISAVGTLGYYWSCDVCEYTHQYAYGTILRINFYGYEYMVPRYRGCMVRPVYHYAYRGIPYDFYCSRLM